MLGSGRSRTGMPSGCKTDRPYLSKAVGTLRSYWRNSTYMTELPVQRENILSRRRSRVRATRHDLQDIFPKRQSEVWRDKN